MLVTQISPQDLCRRLDQGDAITVVDMRQPWEYQAGHIPGAINMFIQEIPARLHELPRDGEVVFQCWHGVTSMDAAGFAIQNGWSAEFVRSLSGGIAGWVEVHGQKALVAE